MKWWKQKTITNKLLAKILGLSAKRYIFWDYVCVWAYVFQTHISNTYVLKNLSIKNLKRKLKMVIEACKTTLNFLEKIPVYVIVRCRTG